MILDKITEKVLHMIDGEGFKQEGAFNLRETESPSATGTVSMSRSVKKKTGRELTFILTRIQMGRRYTFRWLSPPPE